MTEIREIQKRYYRRKCRQYEESMWFPFFAKQEREAKYYQILINNLNKFDDATLIEIGAGGGDNLLAFKRFGFKWENIYANELLEERVDILKENIPGANIIPGDAMELEFEDYFDVVFQSTVFTSILDQKFKEKLAKKMVTLAKSSGLILWYDFKYDNPKNPDVKGIDKAEIRALFSSARRIVFHNVTLAPPIGRRVGKLYNAINCLFPFLRTHIIAEIYVS